MRASGRPALVALAIASAALIPSPSEAATEHPVRTTPAGEFQPARGPNHLAWEQNTKGQPKHFDVFMQPDGGEPVRVNAGRSNAAMGGIDDDLLVYQQYRKKRSDLYFYHLTTGQRSRLPKKVNSKLWEYWPSISEPWLLFGRWRMSNDRRLLILHNLETGERRKLSRIRGKNAFIGPGQVNGDYAVWWRCPNKGRCQVYRYQISTGTKVKIPGAGSYQRAPSVNAEGTVFLARGGKGCGGQVKIVKVAPDGSETILTQFPPALDSRDTYAYTDESGVTHIYYERFGCGKKTGSDIFQVMDPEITGSITVVKDAIPDDSAAFEFDPSPNLQQENLFLDDDGVGSNQHTFSGLAAGTYTVQEVNLPSGWQIIHLECAGDTDGDTTTGMSLASIGLDPGEHIVCTFTNAKVGSITIVKDALPDHSQDFEFDPSANIQTTNFFLDDDPGSVLPTQETFENLDVPGTYTVKEVNIPSDWELTDIVCAGGGPNTMAPTETATATIGLDAGEAVVCTFENTRNGRIQITKQTNPDGSGESFTFTRSYGPNFNLTDGQTHDSGFTLAPGSYSVAENPVPGWDLTGATCNDGSGPGSINLSAGETVTCTFNNRQDAKILVTKQTTPDGSIQSFEFDTDYGFNFFLQDGQMNDSGFLDPGTYSVTELTPAGWDLTSATCSDGSSPGSINLSAGETVMCTFNNRQDGRIVVTKQTIPDGSAQSFTFSRSYGPDFVLTDGQSSDSGFTLNPGTYSVSEAVPEGWALTSATCDDGSAPGSISVSAGETVTCTFENTQQGTITIAKEASPDGALQSFEFNPDYGPNFSLSDGQTNISGDLAPGSYTVIEMVPLLWQLDTISCVDPDNGSGGDTGTATATIDLDPGEAVTCTFTNSLIP